MRAIGATWKRRIVRVGLAVGLGMLLLGPGCVVVVPAEARVLEIKLKQPVIVPCTPVPPAIVVPACPVVVPSPTCPTAAAMAQTQIIVTATKAATAAPSQLPPTQTCPPTQAPATAPPCVTATACPTVRCF